MKCLSCSVDLGETPSKFCPSCGVATSLNCKGCGANVLGSARFCPECGSQTTTQQPSKIFEMAQAMHPAKVSAVPPPPPIPLIAKKAPGPAVTPPLNAMSSRFARFWAKGVAGPFSCWKFSNTSLEEAQSLANARIAQIAENYKRSKILPNKYLYSDRRLREPVIEEVHNSVISRNAYGCLVLNTADVMFVDIDFPEEKPSGFLSIFSSKSKDVQTEIIAQIEAWSEENPQWGWRVYRTFAGLRLLATNGLFAPDSLETEAVFEALGSDPLYRVLCKVQKCFRARLTPKPWRCDMQAPQVRWPWASDEDERNFSDWRKSYELEIKNYATCQLVKIIGNPNIHPSVKPIIGLHDKLSCVHTDLPLA